MQKVQNEKGLKIVKIRSDHGGEFENDDFESFCELNGYDHNFSFPRAPQQNGVVERNNRIIQEMARSMLCENDLPKHFWAKVVNTACYILNRRPSLNRTPFELWFCKTPKFSYFRVFGCKCFILNTKDNLDKFDSKADEETFLGYSSRSKAYRAYNKRTLTVEESLHVNFDENINKIINIDPKDEIVENNFENLNNEENNQNKDEQGNKTRNW